MEIPERTRGKKKKRKKKRAKKEKEKSGIIFFSGTLPLSLSEFLVALWAEQPMAAAAHSRH